MIEYCRKKALEVEYIKGQERLYSVVTDKRGKIVGEGRNSFTQTHPKQASLAKRAGCPDKTFLHSEVSAILSDKMRKGYKITVVRVDSKGNLRYAEPCKICKALIKEVGLKVVEFSV